MSKPNDLKKIFSALSEDPVGQENYFLVLLGTDTRFTKRPTPDQTYENGETLSYFSQVVTTQLGEEAEIDNSESAVLSYSSNSVDVLNGPTTLGTEVGDRVAQAVFLALSAIASGKKTINIPAHSRGAVQAIMVISELARIKTALREQPNLSLFQILQAAPADDDNTFIARAVRKLFQEADNDTPETRKNLLEKLEAVEINPFLIDPVPGGSKFGATMFRWHSPRFYERLQCNSSELILMEHEFTCCFTPVVSNGLQPLVLPGHHGTASGNRYNQQYKQVPEHIYNQDTTTVQTLVLCKLFYFFNQCTKSNQFREGLFAQSNYQSYNLGHPKLDEVAQDFLNATEAERRLQLLDHYTKVQENIEAYRWFTEGSYALLGRQYALDKQTGDKRRYVHLPGQRHSSISQVAPNMNAQFLNQEHALLYLREFVDFDNLQAFAIADAISKITLLLEKTINPLLEQAQPEQQKEEIVKLLELLQSEDGSQLFFNSLSLLIDMISQKYLSHELTEVEDRNLRNVIEEPFHMLKKAKAAGKDTSLIMKMDAMLKKGLKNTVGKHSQSILQQTDLIAAQVSHTESPSEHLQEVFKNFISKLAEGKSSAAGLAALPAEINSSAILCFDNELDSALESQDISEGLTIIQTALRKTTPSSIEEIKQAINEALSLAHSEIIDSEKKDQLENIVSRKVEEFLQPCFDAHETSIEDYLRNIEHLYKLTITLHKDLSSLQNLADDSIEVDRNQLNYRRLALLEMGGRLLKNHFFDLSNPPSYLSENFFELIKKQAIMLGAPSPLEADLRQQARVSELAANSLFSEFQKQAQTINQQERQLAEQKKALGEAKNSHSQFNEEKIGLEAQIAELNNKILAKDLEIEQIRSAQAEQERQGNNNLQLINQLSSDKEQGHTALIQIKLLPLTKEYLSHLFNSAKKYNRDLEQYDLEQLDLLPDLVLASEGTRADYEKIRGKFQVVSQLKQCLENTRDVPLPSLRVQNFKTALDNAEEELVIHRDAKWKRYTASCGAALAIILTGIIPGLCALLIYSKVTEQGNPLFFNHRTRGEAYSSQCNSEILPLADQAEPVVDM